MSAPCSVTATSCSTHHTTVHRVKAIALFRGRLRLETGLMVLVTFDLWLLSALTTSAVSVTPMLKCSEGFLFHCFGNLSIACVCVWVGVGVGGCGCGCVGVGGCGCLCLWVWVWVCVCARVCAHVFGRTGTSSSHLI